MMTYLCLIAHLESDGRWYSSAAERAASMPFML